jgi:class 3 adenylate cyclase/tetratricopeptide (TPR) repeat protein
MPCPRCYTDDPGDAAFCGECGARLELLCAGCGSTNRLVARFCQTCGQPLPQAEDPGRFAREKYGAPHTYTPRHLAEKILTSKASLEGERKQITVLFADLKASMELLAERDPEDARTVLDPVLELMMDAVHRYEGTVNQVMGDGIMALFGAPLAHEDHAVRACYAALRMQETVNAYAETVRASVGIRVQIRIGINSGDVVVGGIGSDLATAYTAVGRTTHLASRIEQLSPPGSIRITADTLKLAEGFVETRELGPSPVKGLAEPVTLYEVIGASALPSRLQIAVTRGLTAFVGRAAEMDQVRQALERAKGGLGQVVAMVGEPGVGKSRLFYEFIHSPDVRDCLVVESVAQSYGKTSAYLPVIELLRRYFRIDERDGTESIREKLVARLRAVDRALEPFLPAFLWLLTVSAADTAWEGLDPAQRRRRIVDGVKALLVRESQVRPVVVVFEDLHWIDSETQALLETLVDAIRAARVLVLVNYRPEYTPGWTSKAHYRQVRIDPLQAPSAAELLESLLGCDPTVQPLTRLLIERTEGTPFFLEESVRMLVETKALVGERGAYRLVMPLATIEVPPTVNAILAARIDRLLPADKHRLQEASVLGKDVPLPLLVAIADEAEDDVRHSLARLQAAELVHETQLFPDLEYAFTHALTHEVAYGTLLHDRRRALHVKTLEAIEARYPARLAEYAEPLADHGVRGEVWDKAAGYLHLAAANAWARGAPEEAVERYERALEVLARLSRTPENIRRSIDIRLSLSPPLSLMGHTTRAIGLTEEAARLAGELGDQLTLGRIAMRIGAPLWIEGRYSESIDYAHRALEIATDTGDAPLRVGATYTLAVNYGALGRYRSAIELLIPMVDGPDAEVAKLVIGANLSVYTSACSWLAAFVGLLGDFPRATRYGERGLAPARSEPLAEAMLFCLRTVAPLVQGEFTEAAELADTAVRLCEPANLSVWLSNAYSLRGSTRVWLGRLEEGLADLEQGATLYETAGGKASLAFLLYRWAEGLFLANRPEARGIARRALELAVARGERANEASALHVVAQIEAREAPDGEAADAHYRRAFALGTEIGLRPLVARCHLGLGELYQRSGKRDRVREHLAAATAMFREMNMRYWLEKAEALT